METLLYFAIWAAVIFLMMRFGCGAHVTGHGHGNKRAHGNSENGQKLRWVAPKKDVDSVCRKTVVTDKAKSGVFDGHVYYFCSRECREPFEAAPDLYAGGENRRGVRQLEQLHG